MWCHECFLGGSWIWPSLADGEYHQRLPQLSAAQLAIIQYPVLEDRIEKLCFERRFERSICSSLPLKDAKTTFDDLLVQDLLGKDERLRLRALQLACTLEARGTDIAEKMGNNASSLMIQSCTLPREKAIQMLEKMLTPENPLLPIVALELRRHKARQSRQSLESLQPKDPLSRTMIDFALQGIPQ